jgi:hypothetical protein
MAKLEILYFARNWRDRGDREPPHRVSEIKHQRRRGSRRRRTDNFNHYLQNRLCTDLEITSAHLERHPPLLYKQNRTSESHAHVYFPSAVCPATDSRPFQSEMTTQRAVTLPPSSSTIFSSPWGRPVAAYVFLLFFSPLIIFKLQALEGSS